MHATYHKPQQNSGQSNELEAEIRARCPKWMKDGVTAIAEARILDDANILREAVAEYLERHAPKGRKKLTA